MLIEDKFTVRGTVEDVWHLLLDPRTLGSCVPGCEKMEVIDKNTYASRIKQKVGPISVSFDITTSLTEIEPPRRFKAVSRGVDSSKKDTFSQDTIVELREAPKGEVEVSYRSQINVVGRLAIMGEGIMRTKAAKIGREFTSALQSRLAG